jgi:hypothetical protein
MNESALGPSGSLAKRDKHFQSFGNRTWAKAHEGLRALVYKSELCLTVVEVSLPTKQSRDLRVVSIKEDGSGSDGRTREIGAPDRVSH